MLVSNFLILCLKVMITVYKFHGNTLNIKLQVFMADSYNCLAQNN